LAPAAVRQRVVERLEVDVQFVMLASDVSQHFLTEATGGQDRGVALIPPFEENLQQVENGLDREGAHVLVPRDLGREAGPSVVQLCLDMLIRLPGDGAPKHAAR
jgi:hypothetical protein